MSAVMSLAIQAIATTLSLISFVAHGSNGRTYAYERSDLYGKAADQERMVFYD